MAQNSFWKGELSSKVEKLEDTSTRITNFALVCLYPKLEIDSHVFLAFSINIFPPNITKYAKLSAINL